MVILDVVSGVVSVVVWRSRWQPAIDMLRRLRKLDNPVWLKMAGKPKSHLAALYHIGRKTGKDYATPVWANRAGQSVFVPLPYGTEVDWCRNVLAAGGCTLDHDGLRYEAVAPVIVPAAEAARTCRRDHGGCTVCMAPGRIFG
jgi:deazaflavin-dependent oxidoreductase (nitroreductase family)